MSLKSEISSILDSNPKVVASTLSGSEEAPKVYFKLNTGNGRHTEKRGDTHEYYRFYEFRGKVKDTEELEYRLKYKRPPE